MTIEPIYEDNHLLVLNKPAGLATMGAAPSLLEWARAYIKNKFHKPGNVYLGVVSRLDMPVTGVLVFARTSKAAARLAEQFRRREVQKTYWALVSPPLHSHGHWVDWLAKDDALRRMRVRSPSFPGAQQAELTCTVLRSLPQATWLEIRPITGRKHQIRVQCSARGSPVLGDRKYGSDYPFAPGIALHARSLVIRHPTRNDLLTFTADVPSSWRRFG